MANDVSSEPATKADLHALEERLDQKLDQKLEPYAKKTDLIELEERLDQKLDQKLEPYAKKTDLEGWAQRIIEVIVERVDKMMQDGFARQRVELARELREDLSADIRSAEENIRGDMRAHIEELKATHATKAELHAHVDDATVHRLPRRRRS